MQGKFTNGEVLYMRIPDGFKEFYDDDEVLRMNVLIYGTKQAVHYFYKSLVDKVKERSWKQSKADPCLYYLWKTGCDAKLG